MQPGYLGFIYACVPAIQITHLHHPAGQQHDVVAQAENGRDAIDLIREHQPLVAPVDYQMPDLDGLAVVRAVVREALPTRVLLLSAATDSAIIYRALEQRAA